MLHKWQADDVAKYSFVEECKLREGKFCITYYDAEGVLKEKKLALRCSVEKLQRTIKEIRMDAKVSLYGKGKHGNVFIP